VAGVTKASGTGLTGFDFRSYTSIEIFNDTFTVTHDTDGTFSETFSTYCKYSTYAEGTGSGTVALTTIPRESILSNVSAFNVFNGVVVSYTAYASFTEYLGIYIGAVAIRTGYELTSGETISFTASEILKFYQNMADLTATVTFKLDTYSGSTKIGSTSVKTASGTIYNASILSNVSSFIVEDGVTLSYTAYAAFDEKLDIKIGATTIRSNYALASGEKITFTSDEILKIYNLISDKTATISFNLKTYFNGAQIRSTSIKTALGTIVGYLHKAVKGVVKRRIIYIKVDGIGIRKCIPYLGVGGEVKEGVY
jgi:hypothetical protein